LRNRGDFTELFEGGFEVLDGFLGENIRISEVVGFFEAFVPEPEDLELALSRIDEFFVILLAPLERSER
jgi:hypothetical protein